MSIKENLFFEEIYSCINEWDTKTLCEIFSTTCGIALGNKKNVGQPQDRLTCWMFHSNSSWQTWNKLKVLILYY